LYQFIYKKLAAHICYPDILLRQQKSTICKCQWMLRANLQNYSLAYGPFSTSRAEQELPRLGPMLSFMKLC